MAILGRKYSEDLDLVIFLKTCKLGLKEFFLKNWNCFTFCRMNLYVNDRRSLGSIKPSYEFVQVD